MARTKALFPGTFYPPTHAHLNIRDQAEAVFDTTMVIAHNDSKDTAGPGVRAGLLKLCDVPSERVALAFAGESIVDTARRLGARVIVRGLRGPSDFEFEMGYGQFIRQAGGGEISVMYFMSPAHFQATSSTLVRSIMTLNGWYGKDLLVSHVPRAVIEYMHKSRSL